MGVVFEAEHQSTGERVALKTVKEAGPIERAALHREILALSQLNHPGIVKIRAQGEDEAGVPWYAMELVPGTSWRALLRDGPAAPEGFAERLQMLWSLTPALGHLHGEGLVHGDLKPDNVVAHFAGHPVLVDFGLTFCFAQASGREALALRGRVGTPEYMAPEQWITGRIDARTDLYALGCMAFELFAGRPPYAGDREAQRRQHLNAPVPLLEVVLPNAPPGLGALIAELMAKDPRARPGNAAQVAARLEQLGAAPEVLLERSSPRPFLFPPGLRGREGLPERVVGGLVPSGPGAPAVWIAGESGVGKTRLLLELAESAQRGGLTVIAAECPPDGGPLAGFRPFLRSLLEGAERDPAIKARLLPRLGTLSRVEPRLGRLGSVGPLPSLDAEAERARLLSDLLGAIAEYGQVNSTFLIFDDLQWADELTLEALDRLTADLGGAAELSVVGAYRSEEVQAGLQSLLDRDPSRIVELPRLLPDAVQVMVTDMLGTAPPPDFARHLAGESEGNPFFVAEYLRAAMEAGLLSLDARGQWAVSAGAERYATLGLPKNLQALIAHRLAGLSPFVRATFEATAILGHAATGELIAALRGQPAAEVDAALIELLRRRFLEEVGHGQLRITHDKLREVALVALDPERRRALHDQAATALLARDAPPAEVARHLEGAGRREEALVAREAAAEQAIATGSYQEATQHLSQVLALAADDPAYDPARRGRWHRRRAELWMYSGELKEAMHEAEDVLRLVDRPAPQHERGFLPVLFKEALVQLFHRLAPESWVTAATPGGSAVDAAEAAALLSRIAFFQNRPLPIVTFALWSINRAERAGHYFAAARNYSGLGWVFGLAGAPKVADAYFVRAKEAGARAGDHGGLVFALTSEAVYRIGLGEWPQVEALLTACEAPCAATRDPQGWELMTTLRGHPAYLKGDLELALDLHRAVLRSARSRGNRQHTAWSHYCVGRAELARGQVEPARVALEAAASLLEGASDSMSVITCQGLLAEAYVAAGDLRAAQTAATTCAQAIGRSPPTVFLTMHGYRGIVRTYLALADAHGPGEQRDQLLREARRWSDKFRRMARQFPVAQPSAELAYGSVLNSLGKMRTQRHLLRGRAIAKRLEMKHDL